jgi:hypothetical protein
MGRYIVAPEDNLLGLTNKESLNEQEALEVAIVKRYLLEEVDYPIKFSIALVQDLHRRTFIPLPMAMGAARLKTDLLAYNYGCQAVVLYRREHEEARKQYLAAICQADDGVERLEALHRNGLILLRLTPSRYRPTATPWLSPRRDSANADSGRKASWLRG